MSLLGPHADKAQQVHNVAVALDDNDRAALWQRFSAAMYAGPYALAATIAAGALRKAGRFDPAFGDAGRWGDELFFHGAKYVQFAVLARDLVADEVYGTLLAPWVEAGLPDPHEAVTP